MNSKRMSSCSPEFPRSLAPDRNGFKCSFQFETRLQLPQPAGYAQPNALLGSANVGAFV
jgi:hypothetical protein